MYNFNMYYFIVERISTVKSFQAKGQNFEWLLDGDEPFSGSFTF